MPRPTPGLEPPGGTAHESSSRSALLSAFTVVAERLVLACAPEVPELSVEVQSSLPSTNTSLLERTRASAGIAPTLLIAVEQTAGRGRRGKPWSSVAKGSLTFSLAWPFKTPSGRAARADADLTGLSLAVGTGLAFALGPQVLLKWPNDLCLKQAGLGLAKLGGILIETLNTPDGLVAVIGVGLNLEPIALPKCALAPEQPRPLTSVGLDSLRPELDGPQVLLAIAPALLQCLSLFTREGWPAFRAAYRERDALAGLEVEAFLPGDVPVLRGIAQGVDEQGALIVHTAEGVRALNVGEVSVRSVQPF